ncbi:molybdopterin-dependent oxidoreductase [Streptomyces sp. WSLK1-5]|uniref:molybdopterin-dependent oxidoreductase n=1 Tax=unclassified Streptomyces TaxID=2593676 RepID=UPI0037ACBF1C
MTENEKEPRSRSGRSGPVLPALGALSGVLAGCAALAVAEAVAGGVRPRSGPVVVVGGAAIDRTPAAVKDWAIRNFGTDDKLVLQLGILAVLALFALALGIVALRFRRTGAAGVLLFGAIGAAAATGRPDSTGAIDALPSLVGAVAGAAVLYVLTGRLTVRNGSAAAGDGAVAGAGGVSRGPEPGPTGPVGPVVLVDGRVADSDPERVWPAEPMDGRAADLDSQRVGPEADRAGDADSGRVGPAVSEAGREADLDAGRVGPVVPVDGRVGGSDPGRPGWDRRGFVIAAGATAAASAGFALLGRSLSGADGRDAVASRRAAVLPRPGSPASPVPRGAGLRIPGVSPFVTPNGDFYRVDTALVVPKVDATSWRLRLHGKGVTRPLTLSYDDLLRRELVERDITLTCVSNEVGGPYVGNARWIGVRLAELLAECGVRPPSEGGPADQLVARSVDGMTIGSPVEDLMDGRDALLALGMNGEPLPFAHGFPVRMVVPGLYGFVSACKWIEDIELTTFDSYDPYWVKRGWARRAPVKTQSRIDTPKPFGRPKAGTVMVAGVAWAQHRGIDKVEIRVDDGPWQQARLAAEDSRDTWRQWSFPWQATKGGHTLTVRATDRAGAVQTDRRARTIPDGASGWHSVVVTVE